MMVMTEMELARWWRELSEDQRQRIVREVVGSTRYGMTVDYGMLPADGKQAVREEFAQYFGE